eukprot:1131460-Prorocentrum_minimum.AAC.2
MNESAPTAVPRLKPASLFLKSSGRCAPVRITIWCPMHPFNVPNPSMLKCKRLKPNTDAVHTRHNPAEARFISGYPTNNLRAKRGGNCHSEFGGTKHGSTAPNKRRCERRDGWCEYDDSAVAPLAGSALVVCAPQERKRGQENN